MTATRTSGTTEEVSGEHADARPPAESPPSTAVHLDDEHALLEPRVAPSSTDYVVPLVHAHVPEPVIDGALWVSLGAVLVVGAIDLPAAGAIAAGRLLIRYRHQR